MKSSDRHPDWRQQSREQLPMGLSGEPPLWFLHLVKERTMREKGRVKGVVQLPGPQDSTAQD